MRERAQAARCFDVHRVSTPAASILRPRLARGCCCIALLIMTTTTTTTIISRGSIKCGVEKASGRRRARQVHPELEQRRGKRFAHRILREPFHSVRVRPHVRGEVLACLQLRQLLGVLCVEVPVVAPLEAARLVSVSGRC
eukprot:1105857-Rhodomonas_salina.3